MNRRTIRTMRSHAWLYLMILPVIVYFIIFVYYPLYEGVNASFQDFKLLGNSEYIGTQNYIDVWNDDKFWQVTKNTILIGGGILFLGFFPPIIIAIALNEVASLMFKRITQTSVYLPHLFSWVVVGGMWILLLAPSGGLVNELLALLDIGPVRFMTDTTWARALMVVLPIWKDMGYGTIIYLAAITSISPTLYEAARIDGASRFQQAYQITLPMLKPTMKVVFMLNVLGVLRIFDQIFVMRNPVVQRGIDVIMTYVYDIGIQKHELGIAGAISVMVLGATLLMTAIVWPIIGFGKQD